MAMSDNNVFGEEWRECLREHYKHVVRNDPNPRNFTSVTKVLTRPNGEQPPIFTESDLRQLYIEATMRAEDMPDDFMPDADMLADLVQTELETQSITSAADEPYIFQPHPLECQCPSCVQINLHPHDAEGQPLVGEALAELEDEQRQGKKRKKDALPKQMSLF